MVYEEAQRQHTDRVCETLMNSENQHKWWSTLKSAVFGAEPSLPPLINDRGVLLYDPAGQAALLADYFDNKQSRDSISLPSSCHPQPRLTSFAFRSKEVKSLLLDQDPYDGTDPLGTFPLFFKKTAEVLATRITVIFRKHLRTGCFPACWRVANVSPIPKGSNYRPIYITSGKAVFFN